MIAIRSIRWRIQLGYALFLIAAVTISGVAVYFALKRDAERVVILNIERNATTILHEFGAPRPGRPRQDGPYMASNTEAFRVEQPFPYYFAIWDREGNLVSHSPFQPPELLHPPRPAAGTSLDEIAHGEIQRGEFLEMYEYSPGQRHCILVGRSMRVVEAKLKRNAGIITAIGFGIIGAGLLAGWWIARSAMRPLREISTAAFRISSGNLSDRISVLDSETELGSLAAVLNDAFTRLQSAIEYEARFTSDAAHELRTPVSVILAETQLALLQKPSAEEALETISACRRAANRMHSLIESLLDLSLVAGSNQFLRLQPCDLAEVAQDSMEIMRLLANERQLSLVSSLDAAKCEADPERILQVLLNLLSNAFKFSPPGNEVSVRARTESGFAVVEVRDNGPGIAAEHLAHIFERFYRVDGSRTRATGGAGLGLAICQSIAQAHQGTISCESTPGKGSTFILRIPAH